MLYEVTPIDNPNKLPTEYLVCVIVHEFNHASFYGNVIFKTDFNIFDNFNEVKEIVDKKAIEQLKMLKLWKENAIYQIAITNIILSR